MAIPFTPDDVASGFNLSKLNNNFDKVETALQDALSRSGTGPNQMEADIDLNSNDLLNVKQIDAEVLTLNGDVVQPVSLSNSLKSSNALSELAVLGLQSQARDNIDAASEAQGAKADNSVQIIENVTAARALTGTLPKTINIRGEDGGTFQLDVADFTSTEDGGSFCGTIIRPTNFATAGVYKRVIDGRLYAKAFGVSPDQADNIAFLHSARDRAIALGVRLIISGDGPLPISDHFTLKSNLEAEWEGREAFLKLTAASFSGAVVTTIDNPLGDLNVVNVLLINPLIDGNNIPGQNGLGIGGAGGTDNINAIGGHYKNCLRSTVNGGGRAVTVQLGASNCSFLDYVAEDCTTAGDVHGWFAVANSQATAIRMRYHAENCEEVFSAFDLQALGSDNSEGINYDVKFTAHNCGIAVVGATLPTDGGAIIFERASYGNISGTLINDAAYGTIGAVVRGKGYHNTIGVEFVGNASALVDGNNATSIEPVTPNTTTPFNDNVIQINHIFGSCTNIVKGDTAAKFLRNHVSAVISTVTGNSIAAPVDDSATSTLEILRRSDGFYANAINADHKAYFPTMDPSFRFSIGNLFRTGNLGVNITGGEVRLNTLAAQNMAFAFNGSTKMRVKTTGVAAILPTYADNAAALAGGLVATDMYKTAAGDVLIVV